ncbi:MAG TPA: DUF6516 family protein [Candidatus Nanoarchaeia archaeon]|nr:DUF6516 family protein [Candidatus Nanoarchaeia archaeon]
MAEVLFAHKHVEENGDIIDMQILRVPSSKTQPEGIAYSLVYIQNNKRVIGYDNFEGHGEISHHHRHVNDRTVAYQFIDEWKLIQDFAVDVEKIKRGIIT